MSLAALKMCGHGDLDKCAAQYADIIMQRLKAEAFRAGELGEEVEWAVFQFLNRLERLILPVSILHIGGNCAAVSFTARVLDKVVEMAEERGLVTGPVWPFYIQTHIMAKEGGCDSVRREIAEAVEEFLEKGEAVLDYLTIKVYITKSEAYKGEDGVPEFVIYTTYVPKKRWAERA
jgi:hypothetical protein